MKGFLYTLIIIVLLALITVTVYNHAEAPIDPTGTATSSDPHTYISETGDFIMRLYETRVIEGTTIHIWAVTEDSRCPTDVQCVWAGKVTVAMSIGTAMGTSTHELEPGESLTTETKKITLTNVLPAQRQGYKIPDEEYRFLLNISDHDPAAVGTAPRPVPAPTPAPTPTPSQGACYVGGCSGQICSDKQGVASTCEWREAYACYQTARCERQPNGQCGWTQTTELSKCLSNAR